MPPTFAAAAAAGRPAAELEPPELFCTHGVNEQQRQHTSTQEEHT